MTVIVPADGIETANAVKAAMEHEGPVYIRIGRGFEPTYYKDEDYGFEIGKAVEVRDGTDITIIAMGITVLQAAEAADFLAKNDGLSVRVINMHTIKPIDKEAILKAVTETRRILTVEEHNVLGGLGTAVADVIAESGKGCAFTKVGLNDEFAEIGYPEDLYSYYKMDADGIIEKVREIMGKDFEEDENWDDEV
jgi:transketolase